MNGLRYFAIGAGLAALLAGPVLAADTPAEARAAIQSAYDGINAAARTKNLDKIFSYYSPDYLHTGAKGEKETLAQLRNGLARILPVASQISGSTVIDKFALRGDRAVTTVHDMTAITLTNPKNPQQQVHLVSQNIDEDTWVKAGGRWIVKASKILVAKQLVNGKPVK